MSDFLKEGAGMLESTNCSYCRLKMGDEFVDELTGQRDAYEGRYRALGGFSVYVLVNLALVWVFGGEKSWGWWKRIIRRQKGVKLSV